MYEDEMKFLKTNGFKYINKKELNDFVSFLLTKGFSLVSETGRFVILRKPKKFNWTAFILLIVFFNIFGLAGYLIYYSAKKGGKEVTVQAV